MFLNCKIDSESNLASKLQGKYFAKSSTSYTLNQIIELDPTTGKLMAKFTSIFFPEADLEEFTPILVSAKQGAFDRVYGPIICKKEDQVIISAGLLSFPFSSDVKVEGFETEIKLESSRFNGYDDTPVVNVTLFKPDPEGGEGNTINYELPVKLRKLETGEKYPSVKELANMFKRSPKTFVTWLGEAPGKNLPVISDKCLPPDSYDVVGYESLTTKTGRQTYLLIIQGKVSDEGLYTQEYISPDDESRETYLSLEALKVWAPSSLNGMLALSPTVNEKYPATYQVRSVKPGSKAGSFRVDSGFILHPDAPVEERGDDLEDLSFLDI